MNSDFMLKWIPSKAIPITYGISCGCCKTILTRDHSSFNGIKITLIASIMAEIVNLHKQKKLARYEEVMLLNQRIEQINAS